MKQAGRHCSSATMVSEWNTWARDGGRIARNAASQTDYPAHDKDSVEIVMTWYVPEGMSTR